MIYMYVIGMLFVFLLIDLLPCLEGFSLHLLYMYFCLVWVKDGEFWSWNLFINIFILFFLKNFKMIYLHILTNFNSVYIDF